MGIASAAFILTTLPHADQLEYTTYRFSDNGDNGVFTTGFNLSKTIWEKTVILLDIEVDQITIPPSLDGATGASRPARRINQTFEKNRGQFIGGVEQGFGDNTLASFNYYQSREVDYFSQSVVGTVTQAFAQKNTTVQVRGQYTWDDVGEILPTGLLVNAFKETQQASFLVTQLMNPTTIVRFGGDVFRLQGMLSDAYRNVEHLFAGAALPDTLKEQHPGERWKYAACFEVLKYFTPVEASMILDYRYYFDDWGLKSNTLNVKFNKYVTSNWIASPEYRYYIQNDADFGDYPKGNPDAFFTGDYKLKQFDSNKMGLGLTYFLRGVAAKRSALDFLGGASISAMYFRYWNSLRFNADVVESKIKFGF